MKGVYCLNIYWLKERLKIKVLNFFFPTYSDSLIIDSLILNNKNKCKTLTHLQILLLTEDIKSERPTIEVI